MSGYILLHRSMNDNPLWLLEPFTKGQAWIDLFMNANWKPGVFHIRGNIVKVKRGQLAWSELTMAKRWKWSRDKVRRFLSYLVRCKNIIQQKTSLTTIITICNYDRFQVDDTTDDTTDKTTERQQKDNRRYTIEEGKEGKEVKHIYGIGENVRLTKAEHGKLKEKLNGKTEDYIDRLSTYHGIKKYKSHYLTILSWWNKDATLKKETTGMIPRVGRWKADDV